MFSNGKSAYIEDITGHMSSAVSEHNHRAGGFLFERFRPEMRVAIDHCMAATKSQPSVEPRLFMGEHSVAVEKDAQKLR